MHVCPDMLIRASVLFCLVVCQLAAVTPAHGQPGTALAAADVCHAAGTGAERAYSIPPGMLVAIGRVESGRRHPVTGATTPWPWTINAAGVGRMFDTAMQAIETTRDLRARGTASIDVGCFQINLLHHPAAFPSLAVAFDPDANADYAGRFLLSLKEKTGSWDDAVAAYHSATPALGVPYRNRVMASLASGGLGGRPLVTGLVRPTVWAMPVVAFGMRVWSPSSVGTAPNMLAFRSMASAPPRPLLIGQVGGESPSAMSMPVPMPVSVQMAVPTVRAGLPPGYGRDRFARLQ